MIVAGLDLSLTATGIVIAEAATVGDERLFVVKHTNVLAPPKSWRGLDRLDWIRREVLRLLETYRAEDLAMEGLAFAAHDKDRQQAGLAWVTRMTFWSRGRSFFVVPPATLKKIVAGAGNAPKEIMLREVFRRWGFEAEDNNAADAYALARCVAGHHLGFERKADGEAWKKAERVAGRGVAPRAEAAE